MSWNVTFSPDPSKAVGVGIATAIESAFQTTYSREVNISDDGDVNAFTVEALEYLEKVKSAKAVEKPAIDKIFAKLTEIK